VPYQVRADLTVLPGVTLSIDPGVEMEFYPNVGMLVLGDLKAAGTPRNPIRMRPLRNGSNRAPYFSTIKNRDQARQGPSSLYFNNEKQLRLYSGLNDNEGFLQVSK